MGIKAFCFAYIPPLKAMNSDKCADLYEHFGEIIASTKPSSGIMIFSLKSLTPSFARIQPRLTQ
ncbi:MAG: hypothetical protein CMK28_07800 [Porticoccaceae bacterium]|nr:hypothetical protein [Porticoccaceae bacterium]